MSNKETSLQYLVYLALAEVEHAAKLTDPRMIAVQIEIATQTLCTAVRIIRRDAPVDNRGSIGPVGVYRGYLTNEEIQAKLNGLATSADGVSHRHNARSEAAEDR